MSSADQKQFNKYFQNRPIAYQAGWTIVFRSVSSGVLLNQLIYWHGKGKRQDGFIFKTADELYKETGLTNKQQALAIRKLKAVGLLEVKLMGIPAKRHFKLDVQNIHNVLPGLKEKAGIKWPNPPISRTDNVPTITKSTQETTSNNTHRIIVKEASDNLAYKIAVKKWGNNWSSQTSNINQDRHSQPP